MRVLISHQDHLAWILDTIKTLPVQQLDLDDAQGYVLAEQVISRHALPLWDNSAMDGYAVRSTDLAAASVLTPVTLRVVGEIPAGSSVDLPLGPGQAARIMTGAPMPSDADTVIPVEQTVGETGPGQWAQDIVQFTAVSALGANVRRQGEDVAKGTVLAGAGQRLTASRIAALAAAGTDQVQVRPVPRVTVVVTGAELRSPGSHLQRGEIYESNSLLIIGLLRQLGIDAAANRNTDDTASLSAQLDELAGTCDVIITTGGVGPGTRDVMRLALEDEAAVKAVRVAVKPGQLQCAGRLRRGAFVFALPGNPVSAAVSFELFVRPALLAMQGSVNIHRLRVPTRAAVAWQGAPNRLQVLPVSVVQDGAELLCTPVVNPRRVSHAVGRHGEASGYALIGPEYGDVAAGQIVPVLLAE